MASTVLVDRGGWSVKSRMLYEDNSKLPWRRRCVTSSMPLEPTCNAALFFFCLWGSLNCFFFYFLFIYFFYLKPCRSNCGPCRSSGCVHGNVYLSKEICGAQTTKPGHGGDFWKREHQALWMLTCMITAQPLVRDDSSSQDKANTWEKMQVTVGFRAYVRLLECS